MRPMKQTLAVALALLVHVGATHAQDYQVGDRLAPRAGAAATQFREISWDDLMPPGWDGGKFLAGLGLDDLQDGDPRASEALAKMRAEWERAPVVVGLAGQHIRIPGFVVPLEGDGKAIREFLLVPYFGACVHVPPPPANQLIHVVPDKPVPAQLNMAPVWVEGVLAVGRVASDMGTAGYQLRGIRVEPYEERPRR